MRYLFKNNIHLRVVLSYFYRNNETYFANELEFQVNVLFTSQCNVRNVEKVEQLCYKIQPCLSNYVLITYNNFMHLD